VAPLAPILLGVGAVFAIDTLIRWYTRTWYFVGIIPLVALAGVVIVDKALEHDPWTSLRAQRRDRLVVGAMSAVVAALALATAWGATIPHLVGSRPLYPWQGDMYRATMQLRSQIPPDARVAAFNSGILGFYSDRETVNADGVVNIDALHALQREDMAAYLRSQGVTYVVDFDWAIKGTFQRFWGGDVETLLTPVENMASPQDPYMLYQIAPPPETTIAPP
jgi:hypothetical protein